MLSQIPTGNWLRLWKEGTEDCGGNSSFSCMHVLKAAASHQAIGRQTLSFQKGELGRKKGKKIKKT